MKNVLGKKIGSGLQYTVYALNNKRVLKKVRPLKEMTATCRENLASLFFHPKIKGSST